MGAGDELLAAGQAQRLFDATRLPSIIADAKGKPRWHPIWAGNPAIVEPESKISIGYQTIINGPNCRPYIVYPFTEETGWTFNTAFRAREHIAKIYLTDEERSIGEQLRARFGRYVLIDPWSKHANLRWPWASWERLVAALPHVPWVQQYYRGVPAMLPNVAVHATNTFREACGALADAALYIRGESGMCHAAAAFGKEQITLWGGCMDWNVLGGYPGQIGLGISDPCGSWKPCDHCQRCMASISVEDVVSALAEVGVR